VQAPFTHGEDGIQAVPRGTLFGLVPLAPSLNLYFFVLAVFLLGLFIVYRIVNSPFGMILKAIRENETRAISLGYSVDAYKLAAFVISAGLAGLAGSVRALVSQFATLTDTTWQMSGEAILMTLLGGIGTFIGPLFGAAVVVSLQNYLATSTLPVGVVTGFVFMICVLAFRHGIVGAIGRLQRSSADRIAKVDRLATSLTSTIFGRLRSS
jgi:branched-chain amino acid transport system permease protein